MRDDPTNLGLSFSRQHGRPQVGRLWVKHGTMHIPVITGYPIERVIDDINAAIQRLVAEDHVEFIALGDEKRYELQITKRGALATFALVSYAKSLHDPVDGKMRCDIIAELPFEKLIRRLIKSIARFRQDPDHEKRFI